MTDEERDQVNCLKADVKVRDNEIRLMQAVIDQRDEEIARLKADADRLRVIIRRLKADRGDRELSPNPQTSGNSEGI